VTNFRIHFLTPQSSRALVGGPLRTICTPIVSASILLDRKSSSHLWFTIPRMHNSGGIHAHRGRYIIWLVFLHVSLSCLTPSEQLATCDILVDLAAIEITSNMTPENVVDEMFCYPPPCVPSPAPIHTSLTTEPAQPKLFIEGWRSSGKTVAMVTFGPSCRRCLMVLPPGRV
jgi:hypothetical protein